MPKQFFTAVLAMLGSLPGVALNDEHTQNKSPDKVIKAYVQAVGGMEAIERIETREITAKSHHHSKATYFWQKPNKVLLVQGKKKIGFDGGSGWMLSQKKRVSKLAKGSELALEMDANPLRYAHLRQLYPDAEQVAAEVVDGQEMDVLAAANDLGLTKFYFDAKTHLLSRVEETGESSAYFKHKTDYSDYKDVDGVRLPFRIVHETTEPDVPTEDLRILEVKQNVPLRPELFRKPAAGSVVLGGKR